MILTKPTAAAKLGIRLTGQGQPCIVGLNPELIAAQSNELAVGDVIHAVNGQSALGHAATTEMLRQAVGEVRLGLVVPVYAVAADRETIYLNQPDDPLCDRYVDSVIQYARQHPEVPLCVDLEWDSHDANRRLSLFQITTGRAHENMPLLIFDAIKIPGIEQRFKDLLESQLLLKAMHDPRQDAVTLSRCGIQLCGLFDTQLGHWLLHTGCAPGYDQRGLAEVRQAWLQTDRPSEPRMSQWHRTQHAWLRRPLPDYVIEYAACDIRDLPALYEKMRQRSTNEQFATILKRSCCPRATLKDIALEFFQYLKANPNVMLACEDYQMFKSTWLEWKERQAVMGSISSIYDELSKLKLVAKKGQTVAFADGGTTLSVFTPSSRRQALHAAAERVNESRAQIEEDKGGISVTPLSFADEVIPPGGTAEGRVQVANTGSAFRMLRSVKLLRCSRMGSNAPFGVEIEQRGERIAASTDLEVELNPGTSVAVIVRCRPSVIGMSYDTLSINFGSFTIGRFLEACCGDAELLSSLAPTAPYQKQRKRRPQDDAGVEEVPPPKDEVGGGSTKVKLGEYKVPPEWRRALGSEVGGNQLTDGWDLVAETDDRHRQAQLVAYSEHYKRLLWSEERQLHLDLSEFDLVGERSTTIEVRGRCMGLHVAGLAEKRPSVLKGDLVAVNLVGEPSRRYLGRAEKIELETVLLRFDNRLHQLGNRVRVEVRFKLGRGPLRVFHQGIAQFDTPERRSAFADVLFPPAAARSLDPTRLRPPRVDVSRLRFINRSVEENPQQRQAVECIVAGEARHVPYIIFGPPGTGKTTTVVEAILQCAELRRTLPQGFRMLVCAPTNTAADLVCQKVLERNPNLRSTLLRLMAYSRSKQEVPEAVLSCSNWNGESFDQPAPAEVLSKSIVVSTLSLAGKLQNTAGVERGHFDLIVIDESGQALEPEAVAPVAMLLNPAEGQLVLAGDPRQLGPVIHHTLAKKLGLAMSLLERLMSRPLYQPDGGYNSLVLTKLVRNFRSHEALLQLPSRLFYGGELEPCADQLLANCCSRWEELPAQGVPLVWQGVNGRDEREGNSPSWFNRDECQVVLKWVAELMRDRTRLGLRENGEDIGIITPYNKQAQKLQFMLRSKGFTRVGSGGIKVGSTELFQGQERKVIIISTVRSNADHVGFDIKHNLGFLDNPKRFNVAVTRACSLLIVVGNPAVLARDRHWGELLAYCHERHAYIGVPVADAVIRPDLFNGGEIGGEVPRSEAATAALTHDLDELLRRDDGEPQEEASHAFQQEGMEMPEHDS